MSETRVACDVCSGGAGGTMYGPFAGGDPRRFDPDEECCTPEEIAAHKAACEAWERGEGVERGPGCQTFGDGSAIDGTGYGIGITTLPADDCGECGGTGWLEVSSVREGITFVSTQPASTRKESVSEGE